MPMGANRMGAGILCPKSVAVRRTIGERKTLYSGVEVEGGHIEGTDRNGGEKEERSIH